MSKPQPDRSAFPAQGDYAPGVSKREWFAAQALVGLLAGRTPATLADASTAARLCVKYADALLAELHPAPVPAAADEFVDLGGES